MYNRELFDLEIRVEEGDHVLDKENITSLYFDPVSTEFTINLAKYTQLRHFRTNEKSRYRENLSSLINLEQLVLYGIDRNKEDISKMLDLKYVSLTRGNLENLDKFKNLGELLSVDLYGMSKLNSIESLSFCKNLTSLEIESCKNIQDAEKTLVKLKNLKVLKLLGFKFENIEWIKELNNLESLVIIDTNILSGDISPAKNINYVAIDNKRHYNYKFDDKTKKIIPKVPKLVKAKRTDQSIVIEPFDVLKLNSLEASYEAELVDENLSVSLDMNFDQSSIKKTKLDIVKHITSLKPSNISVEMINLLKSVSNHESISLYKEFIEEEFDNEYKSIELFLDTVQLKRIGFYPEGKEAVVVFDIGPKDLKLDHLLCLHMNRKKMIFDISIES